MRYEDGMQETTQGPYSLTIQASRGAGTFQWSILKNGKLLERSDRMYRSEDDAVKNGEKALDRYANGAPAFRA